MQIAAKSERELHAILRRLIEQKAQQEACASEFEESQNQVHLKLSKFNSAERWRAGRTADENKWATEQKVVCFRSKVTRNPKRTLLSICLGAKKDAMKKATL